MKTEKQIKILTERMEKEIREEMQKLDRIEIEEQKLNEIPNLIPEEWEIKNHPIMKDGCIVINGRNYIQTMLFSCYVKDNGKYGVQIETAIESNGNLKNVFVYEAEQDAENANLIDIKGYADAELIIYDKQKRNKDYIGKLLKEKRDKYEGIIGEYLMIMSYLHYIMENPETKEVERNKRNGNDKTYIQDCNTNNTVIINGIKIISNNKSFISTVGSKKKRKYSVCWNVIGHYRHYKSGKVVFIKSHTRGNANKAKKSKIFLIK